MIGSLETHRLTTDPAPDGSPSWSPDGRLIAFVRGVSEGAATIHLVSPLGGSDRKLSDLAVSPRQLSWSPDGRWLAAARTGGGSEATLEAGGIYLITSACTAWVPARSPRPPYPRGPIRTVSA